MYKGNTVVIPKKKLKKPTKKEVAEMKEEFCAWELASRESIKKWEETH